MPQHGALRDEIHQRRTAGESQRAIATALGMSRWELWHVLQTPEEPSEEPAPSEEPEVDPEPDPEPSPMEDPPRAWPDPESDPAPEPVTASQALVWLQAYAERVESQAQQAYAPWHTLKLVQEMSAILVAVIKEFRAHANDEVPH